MVIGDVIINSCEEVINLVIIIEVIIIRHKSLVRNVTIIIENEDSNRRGHDSS